MATVIDVKSFPDYQEVGFTGGRDNFKEFCRRIFTGPEPRFLRNSKDQLVVFRHADLQAFGNASEIGNAPIGKLYPDYTGTVDGSNAPGSEIRNVISKQVFTFNPPLHGAARKILTTWLGPKQVLAMESVARAVAQSIVDELSDGKEIDFVAEVADRMTICFWTSILKLTPDEGVELGKCAHGMTRLFKMARTHDDLMELDRAFSSYAKILDIAANRNLALGDREMHELNDKIKLLDFNDDPREVGLVPKSLGQFLAGNLVDGVHTAALASANTFFVLLNHPEALQTVKNSSELLARAITESLRLEPPVLYLPRYALRDFHYDGLVVPAGNVISMMWAAGNYDPSVFPQPDKFDITRQLAGTTTFGNGIHICPGRYVGVMLVKTLIETFAAKRLSVQPGTAPATWFQNHMMAQLENMPVRAQK